MKKGFLKIIMEELHTNKQILLFDGVCSLCNGVVQYVITRDKKATYLFTSLQSEAGQKLLQKHNLPTDLSTIILINKDKVYSQSDVPLIVGQELGGWRNIARLGWLIPKGIRDKAYDFIAANRYRFFGKEESCMLPRPEWRNRFLV